MYRLKPKRTAQRAVCKATKIESACVHAKTCVLLATLPTNAFLPHSPFSWEVIHYTNALTVTDWCWFFPPRTSHSVCRPRNRPNCQPTSLPAKPWTAARLCATFSLRRTADSCIIRTTHTCEYTWHFGNSSIFLKVEAAAENFNTSDRRVLCLQFWVTIYLIYIQKRQALPSAQALRNTKLHWPALCSRVCVYVSLI